MNQGNWMYSGNTLYCGNRQPQMPSWINQQPSQGQRYTPGQGQGQGYNPGYSTLPASVNYPSYTQTQSAGCTPQGGCSDPITGSYNPLIQGPGYATLPGKIDFASDADESEDTGSGDAIPSTGE